VLGERRILVERCLLERLGRGTPTATIASNAGVAIDSVVSNLRRLFNARQGCSETRPDLGMPDFGDMQRGINSALPEIIHAVKTLVEQFEPRLRNVQVRHDIEDDQPQTIRFSIRADLVLSDGATPIRFAGTFGGDGHVEVQS
jgi:type VI secretion system protein